MSTDNNTLSEEELKQTIGEICSSITQPQQPVYMLMFAAVTQIFYIVLQKADSELQKLLNQLKGELNQ